MTGDPVGMHRVLEPVGVLPQAAQRLDTDPAIRDDEVRLRVQRLNLDAASFRQLETKHGGDGDAVRAEVLEIVRSRGKMHNPVTGSGGMLVGTVIGVLVIPGLYYLFGKIADGEFDHISEQAFFNIGGLEDLERNWARIQKDYGV